MPVDTGYYDQTHIQVTKGLVEGDTILKAPLLHAKELNVGGGLFGYRKLSPEDLGIELPETKVPAKPAPSTAKSGGHETPALSTQTKVAQKGKSRPGGSRKGGSGQTSEPPAELKLTAEQKTQWAAAANKMAYKRADIMSRQAWAELRALGTEFKTDLEKFLTEKQLAQYEQSRSQRSQKGKGTGGGRGSRGGSLMDLDTDSDGKVTEEEYSKLDERARQFMGEFSTQDTDGDGGITKEEADAARQRMMQRLRQLQGGGGSGGGGE